MGRKPGYALIKPLYLLLTLYSYPLGRKPGFAFAQDLSLLLIRDLYRMDRKSGFALIQDLSLLLIRDSYRMSSKSGFALIEELSLLFRSTIGRFCVATRGRDKRVATFCPIVGFSAKFVTAIFANRS